MRYPALILLLLEAWYSWKEHKEYYEVKDTFSSLAMGIGNVISGFLSKHSPASLIHYHLASPSTTHRN